MEKYESVPKRLKEYYHTIKDDTLLKPTSTPPLPLSDDREHDEIHEATQLSLALEKPTKAYEEQQNVAAFKGKILEDDVEKIVKGKEDDDGSEFANTVLLSDEDYGDRTRVTGSLKIKTKKMQTPIPPPPKSSRTGLSLDKAIDQELTVSITPTPATLSQDQSKPTSSKCTNLLGSIAKMTRRRSQLRYHMNNTFVTNRVFQERKEEMCETLRNEVLELTISITNDLMKESLPKMVTDAVNQERESSQVVVPALILPEFVARAPLIIEELFRIYMQNKVINGHPTTSTSTATIFDLQQQLYLKMKSDLQAQVDDPELWDVLKAKFKKSSALVGSCRDDAFLKRNHDEHQGDDAPPD
ncbi:hypothetical protein Tco_1278180, partial [Tanacetum coccineum]